MMCLHDFLPRKMLPLPLLLYLEMFSVISADALCDNRVDVTAFYFTLVFLSLAEERRQMLCASCSY